MGKSVYFWDLTLRNRYYARQNSYIRTGFFETKPYYSKILR